MWYAEYSMDCFNVFGIMFTDTIHMNLKLKMIKS